MADVISFANRPTIVTNEDALLFINDLFKRGLVINDCLNIYTICILTIREKYIMPFGNEVCKVIFAILQHKSYKEQLIIKPNKLLRYSSDLTKLPKDIWSKIAPHLDVVDWYNLCHVSRDFHVMCTDFRFLSEVDFFIGLDLKEEGTIYGGNKKMRFEFWIGSKIHCLLYLKKVIRSLFYYIMFQIRLRYVTNMFVITKYAVILCYIHTIIWTLYG